MVTLLAHGCPLHAIVVALGSDERTVAGWVARGGDPGQAVQEYRVEPPRDLGQGHADEIRVKKQGDMVWMQRFPPIAPMSHVTMMSEQSAGDLTSLWL